MEYSIDFSNDKVSDQITLSGSNLSFEGGTGGEIYTVIITVKGTQKFPDNWIPDNDEFNYDEQTFTVKLSDDDYIAVNASSNTTPSTSSLTKISVTEDIRGGVLLDLTSLNIDEGSIKIKSWGRDSNYSNDYFSDYFYLDEKVLKLKDDVIFNTDRDEITRLDSGFYYPNATSGEFDIVFDYGLMELIKDTRLKLQNLLILFMVVVSMETVITLHQVTMIFPIQVIVI